MQPYICIQQNNFNQEEHYSALATGPSVGAVVTFVGRVREFMQTHDQTGDQTFWLEHYPGMTEKVLERIAKQAAQRWPLLGLRIVHRVGELMPGDQIVFIGVGTAHRHQAFAACEYLIDCLKTEAPFWKREGDRWVAAKKTDEDARERWTLNE